MKIVTYPAQNPFYPVQIFTVFYRFLGKKTVNSKTVKKTVITVNGGTLGIALTIFYAFQMKQLFEQKIFELASQKCIQRGDPWLNFIKISTTQMISH